MLFKLEALMSQWAGNSFILTMGGGMCNNITEGTA
jgi:hypothetical protein